MSDPTDSMTLTVKELLGELHKYEDFDADATSIPVSDLILLMSVAQTVLNCSVE